MLKLLDLLFYSTVKKSVDKMMKPSVYDLQLFCFIIFLNTASLLLFVKHTFIKNKTGDLTIFIFSGFVGVILSCVYYPRAYSITKKYKDKNIPNIYGWLFGYSIFTVLLFLIIVIRIWT
jgi:hypothetical protein